MSEYNPDLGYNPLKYIWAVVLASGREIWQYDPHTGLETLIKDVPLDEVKIIFLLPVKEELAAKLLLRSNLLTIPNNNPPIKIVLKEGQRPIIFKTQKLHLSQSTGEKKRETLYCVGYQETVEGRNYQVILTVSENGQVFLGHPEVLKAPTFYDTLYHSAETSGDIEGDNA